MVPEWRWGRGSMRASGARARIVGTRRAGDDSDRGFRWERFVKSRSERQPGQRRDRIHAGSTHDLGTMAVHRAGADAEIEGNALGGLASNHQRENVVLLRRETGEAGDGVLLPAEEFGDDLMLVDQTIHPATQPAIASQRLAQLGSRHFGIVARFGMMIGAAG